MCLILAALDAHPDYTLIVAANRDEFYDRPTASAAFWPEHPRILGGRDLRAGGTWLAVARSGRFAAVTNYRQGEREAAAPRSRGLLVSDYLSSEVDATAYAARVEREGAEYNGFNLLAGDARELHWLSNREGRPRRLGPGIYGLSNHLLDTPWPKVAAGKTGLQALLGGSSGDHVSASSPCCPIAPGSRTTLCRAPESVWHGSACCPRRSSPRPSTAPDRPRWY
jgi:uncharacterized protein with NRDE domain